MKNIKIFFIIIGVILLTGISWALINAGSGNTLTDPNLLGSRQAPDFKLKLLSGETITLSDFKGNTPVVINFWASWCPPCREEAPVLAKVSAAYANQVKFIGVVTNDTPAKALAFMKEFGITYYNGIDNTDIAQQYKITGIPETFWINKDGRIIDHWIGAIDEANLTSRIRKLIQ